MTPATRAPQPYGFARTLAGYRVTLPFPPLLNNLYCNVGRRRVLSERGKAYHRDVGIICGRMQPLAGAVAVHVDAYRPRRVGDIDGTTKVLFDALTGLAWDDDGQIVELHIFRRDDKARPRVEVLITAAGAEGGRQ
jgi:crossover junction endodeoxyribonuclease RusA